MDTITNVFFPKMEKFIKKIDTYNEDHELMREVLRRYDETISHKATRFEMRQMEIKLTESFITQNLWDKMQRDYEKLKEDFENTKLEYEESLTQFKIQESDQIMSNIKYTMQEHFERYEEVYQEFKKFFNMNSMVE